MTRVWESFPLGGSDLLALLALADWSDDQGRCFPSIDSIASKTRLSRSQAQRVVHGLIDKGFLSVTENANGGAPGSTRRYRINLEALTGRMGATGSAGATGRMGAAEGSHGCGETGRMGATLTVIEPSLTVSTCDQAKPDPIPRCPHDEVIRLFGEKLPTLPQPRPELWSGKKEKDLRARWRWVLTAKRATGERYATTADEAMDWFARFFDQVAESDFLSGRNGKWAGCDMPWLMNGANFAKVVEGKYLNREAAHA